MTYQVALLNFEGPLDLLLQLVERADLPASELSLATLTEQYLAHLGALTDRRADLDPHETSQFTALAAQLVYIKSAALMPDAADREEAAAEAAALQQQLEEYGRYREAAAELAALLATDAYSWPRAHPSRPQQPAPAPNLTPPALQQAFASALARATSPTSHQVSARAITLEEMTERLRATHSAHGTATLQDFFAELGSRLEVVVAFLAALELWRQGQLHLTQSGRFSIIKMQYAEIQYADAS